VTITGPTCGPLVAPLCTRQALRTSRWDNSRHASTKEVRRILHELTERHGELHPSSRYFGGSRDRRAQRSSIWSTTSGWFAGLHEAAEGLITRAPLDLDAFLSGPHHSYRGTQSHQAVTSLRRLIEGLVQLPTTVHERSPAPAGLDNWQRRTLPASGEHRL